MKKLIAPLVAALVLTGCVVESIYPWYTARDVTFDPALVGRWVEADAAADSLDGWTFEKAGANGYWLTTVDGRNTNRYEMHLFRLGQRRFLDVCSTNRVAGQVPTHYLLTVSSVDPALQMATLKYDWLTKLLEKNPGALRHLIVPDGSGETNDAQLVLTASTKELQTFLLQHAGDTNAFEHLDAMKRQPE